MKQRTISVTQVDNGFIVRGTEPPSEKVYEELNDMMREVYFHFNPQLRAQFEGEDS